MKMCSASKRVQAVLPAAACGRLRKARSASPAKLLKWTTIAHITLIVSVSNPMNGVHAVRQGSSLSNTQALREILSCLGSWDKGCQNAPKMQVPQPPATENIQFESSTQTNGTDGSTQGHGGSTGGSRHARSLQSKGRAAFLRLPVGLRNLIKEKGRYTMPEGAARILAACQSFRRAPSSANLAANGSSSSSSGSGSNSGGSRELLTNSNSNSQNSNGQNSNFNATEAANVVAQLAIWSSVLDEANQVLQVISSALALYEITFISGPIDYLDIWISRVSFYFDSYSFGQTLYSDFNDQIDNSDYLGDLAKYIKLWNAISQEISGGQMSADMADHMSQLALAQEIVQGVIASAGGKPEMTSSGSLPEGFILRGVPALED